MAWKELDVEDWFAELEEGLNFRRKYGLEDQWAESEALFYNVHESQLENPGPNIILSTGDALLSTLSVPRPYITVKAKRGGRDVESARVIEGVDNLLLDEMGLAEEVETASLYAYLWGKGFLKLGYDSEWGWDKNLEAIKDMGASLTQFDKKGRKIEFSARVRPGMPWARAVPPHDVVVPWGTRDLKSSPWVCHRVVRHVDDVKADPKYENTKDLQPVMSMEDFVKSYQSTLKVYRLGEVVAGASASRSNEYVELWEFHDSRTGKVIVTATGHDKFLRNETDLLQLRGLPFVELSFVPRSRNIWVTGDAQYLHSHQSEQNDIALQSSKQRRLSILKFLYAGEAFEDQDLENLLSPQVGAGVKVKPGMPLDQAVKTFQAQPDPMLWNEAEFSRRNAREIVGFSRNQMGEFDSSTRRTAYEAKTVQQGSDLRMGRRQVSVKRLYVEVFQQVNEMVFEFWNTPRWVEILGEDNLAQWVQYTGGDIRGDFRYEVGFSSEQPTSLGGRRQEAIQLYTGLSQDPMVDQAALREYLVSAYNDPELRKVFGGAQNASLQLQMQQMLQGGGAVQQNRQPQTPPRLPGV